MKVGTEKWPKVSNGELLSTFYTTHCCCLIPLNVCLSCCSFRRWHLTRALSCSSSSTLTAAITNGVTSSLWLPWVCQISPFLGCQTCSYWLLVWWVVLLPEPWHWNLPTVRLFVFWVFYFFHSYLNQRERFGNHCVSPTYMITWALCLEYRQKCWYLCYCPEIRTVKELPPGKMSHVQSSPLWKPILRHGLSETREKSRTVTTTDQVKSNRLNPVKDKSHSEDYFELPGVA